jgi:hypothetical protein
MDHQNENAAEAMLAAGGSTRVAGHDARRRARARLTSALLLALTACTTWKPTTTPLPLLLAKEQPQRLRVSLVRGGTITLRNPILRGDSLVDGRSPRSATIRGDPLPSSTTTAESAVALSDVTSVAVGRTKVLGTLGVAVSVVAGGFLVILIHDCARGCFGFGH